MGETKYNKLRYQSPTLFKQRFNMSENDVNVYIKKGLLNYLHVRGQKMVMVSDEFLALKK